MIKRVPKKSARSVALLILIACCGCRFIENGSDCGPDPMGSQVARTLPANFYVSPYFQRLRPRRVVIVTPPSQAYSFHEQGKFAEAFSDQLRRLGVADAVIAPGRNCDQLAARNGHFDEQQLVELRIAHNADAVAYCDVTSFSAYSPMKAAVSVTLVDCREAIVMVAIDGLWDLRNPETRASFRQTAYSHTQDSRLARNVLYQSPTEFLSFTALEIAQLIQSL